MKNPTFDNRHLKEYVLYGIIGALLYCTTVILLLSNNKYENFYYLYIGNALFMATIFYYALKLVYRPYDKKRAVSMLMAGLITTLTGVVLSAIVIVVAWLFFFPHPERPRVAQDVLENATPGSKTSMPGGLLFMLILNNVLCNTAVGAFISVITAYAGKLNQTKDRPADLNQHIAGTNE